jgi:hypothetical protein
MRLAQTKLRFLLPLLLPLIAAGCTGGKSRASETAAADQPEVPVTKEVLQAYDRYLQKHLPLAFAVGADGRGYGFVYCDGMHCTPAPQARADTVSYCNESYKDKGNCAVFAVGRAKPRKYHVID